MLILEKIKPISAHISKKIALLQYPIQPNFYKNHYFYMILDVKLFN